MYGRRGDRSREEGGASGMVNEDGMDKVCGFYK